MPLLDRIKQDGFNPKKQTANEYASPCFKCGGEDRFRIFTDQNRYWCRQCGVKGDLIQYLRDYHGMDYRAAAEEVGKPINTKRPHITLARQQSAPKNKLQKPPQPPSWKEKAKGATDYAHTSLLAEESVLEWLRVERGITAETVKRFQLGWFKKNFYRKREDWGLEVTGKKLFFPSGLVIPWQDKRIRIRRDNPEGYGRYYVVPGSKADPMIVGSPQEALGVIVESELDAILLSQESDRELFIVALGSAQMKPDEELTEQLSSCPIILVALDTDEAGAKASRWWVQNFDNAFRTLVPSEFGKDLTDAFLAKIDLNDWIAASLELCCESILDPKETNELKF